MHLLVSTGDVWVREAVQLEQVRAMMKAPMDLFSLALLLKVVLFFDKLL